MSRKKWAKMLSGELKKKKKVHIKKCNPCLQGRGPHVLRWAQEFILIKMYKTKMACWDPFKVVSYAGKCCHNTSPYIHFQYGEGKKQLYTSPVKKDKRYPGGCLQPVELHWFAKHCKKIKSWRSSLADSTMVIVFSAVMKPNSCSTETEIWLEIGWRIKTKENGSPW